MEWNTVYEKQPRKLKKSKRRNSVPTRWLRREYGIGPIIACAVILCIWQAGLPHIRWNAYYTMSGFSDVHYTRCHYTGPVKTFEWRPINGDCPLVKWVRLDQ